MKGAVGVMPRGVCESVDVAQSTEDSEFHGSWPGGCAVAQGVMYGGTELRLH
jgi:hypothetical protein